jgi:hypothetical protein
MRMTPLNGLAPLALLVLGFLGVGCQAEPAEPTGEDTDLQGSGALLAPPDDEGVCKTRDEIPPPPIDAPNGGACPAVGSSCGEGLPISLCNDGERRMALTCDAATQTWRVSMKECAADDVVPAAAEPTTETTPSPSDDSAPAPCKPRDQMPPPPADAPNGGACPALGSACGGGAPVSICRDGERRMVLSCDVATGAWQVSLSECPAAAP